MTVQRGKDLLLKIESGSDYVTVAGLRSRKLSFNAETVDVTDAESSGRWRELLSEAGTLKASLSGSGLFKDQSSDELVRAAFFAGSLISFQVVIPDFGTMTGLFQVTALDYSGDHDGELKFDISLESAGEITFGAAA
ncbi:phage major tail protein, TP901-1 family [Allorhizobium sp. BGMRC 0089]|uniref:phage major tail protein, TP901-1 family n=1 Tax=Allorhizobium sonneratiae TaxID=2934936 RepID=UPI00203383B5|nr:phage major tail protein, TP901-1 family [Allorhizobium sonneratiae]MCM2291903.1 phage major tail protein, TP901-1 family [Allorhizobium sonneratiae]